MTGSSVCFGTNVPAITRSRTCSRYDELRSCLAWVAVCFRPRGQCAQQILRFAQHGANELSFLDRVAGEEAVLDGIAVPKWRPGSRCAAVHAAARLAAQRRRTARFAVPCLRAAALGRLHRAGVAGVAHAVTTAASAKPGCAAIRLACWVKWPTTALPPSCTDKFCTVIAHAPLLRWRFRASIWAA
jgi:hypothetical protein